MLGEEAGFVTAGPGRRNTLRRQVLITTALTAALAGVMPHGARAQAVGYTNAGSLPSYTVSPNAPVTGSHTGLVNSAGASIGVLSNNGTISGTGDNGISNTGSIGTLNNSSGATIFGGGTGIVNDQAGSIGTLSNSGTISVGANHTVINNEGAIGTLSNSGIISGGDSGVYNNGGSIGMFSNSGVISGTTWGSYNDGAIDALTNQQGGSISGGATGFYNDAGIGTLSNNGVVSGGTFGVWNDGGSIGTLSNTGAISAGSSESRGVSTGVYNDGGAIGTLINSGSITGAVTGILNQAEQHGGEGGPISGVVGFDTQTPAVTATGKYLSLSSIGILSNSGVISGGISGIQNGGFPSIFGTSVVHSPGSIGTLSNSGSISGGEFGILNADSGIGTLSNNGTITGGLAGVLNGEIESATNQDESISSATVTAYAPGTIGVLNNSGVISSGTGVGILNNVGTIGGINNSGLIIGATDAILNTANGTLGPIVDSGMIEGNIENDAGTNLTISGASGNSFGTLTGYNGASGTITSAGLTLAAGNLVLNDSIDTGSNDVVDDAASVLVNGQVNLSSTLLVQNGLLEVGDAADPGAILGGNVSIASASELRGHGTVGGNVTSDGIVAPGGSIGELTVGGNYTQNAGGTLQIEVTPVATAGTGYDQLIVRGSASLAGALDVQVDNGTYYAGTTYTIVATGAGVSGTFDTVGYSQAFAAYLTPVVNYTTDDVLLTLVPTPVTPGGPVAPGDLAFSTGRIYVASNFAQNAALFTSLSAPMGGLAGPGNETDKGYWLHGVGSYGSANGYDINEKGFVLGKGFAVSPNLILGAAISNIYTNTSGHGSNVDGSSFGGEIYGIYNTERLTVSASLGVGHLSDNLNRSLTGLGETAKAASNGEYEGAAAELQYSLYDQGGLFAGPYGTLSYLHTGLGSAQETGAGVLDLRYDAMSTSLAEAGAGLIGGWYKPVRYGMLSSWVSLGGEGTLGNTRVRNTETLGSFQAGETAIAAPVGAFTPAAGLTLSGNGPWSMTATWGGQYGSAATNESFSLQGRYVW